MIHVLTGPVCSGKSTILKKVVQELARRHVKINGFISESFWESQEANGYDLFDLKEAKHIPFIRKRGKPGWQRIGDYFFIPSALNKAEEIILRDRDASVLAVDEVGPLELSGKGLWPALKQVVFQPHRQHILVIRRNILEDFLEVLNKQKVKVFDIKDKNIFSSLVEAIISESYPG